MAPEKAGSLSQEGRCWQEIEKAELSGYISELKDTLEAVCKSPAFQTSPKSREFLRHIVLHTLHGDVDVLKERLIGMELLGRDASYDTSTDAGVRVRANDVRKRLNACNESQSDEVSFSFRLPAGSYIPLFFRSEVEQQIDAPPQETPQERAPRLSFDRLALPTLAALFLCIICVRWQFAQEHSFTSFWQQVLEDDRAQLYLPPSRADGGQDLVAIRELKAAAPLLDLAGEFHHKLTLISTPAPAAVPGGILVYIGVASGNADELTLQGARRFTAEDTPSGRAIFDRSAPNPQQPLSSHAALLTIVDGTRRLLYIDGTDDAAIRMLVERLCDQSTFPAVLADSFHQGTITQAVFPTASHAEATIVHEALPPMQTSLEQWP
jgi:hypothetical protein